MVYDLLCVDSKNAHPEFEAFLNMTWNVTNTRVRDELEVSYSFIPLAFHQHVWPVTKLIPYVLDTCEVNPNSCIFMGYMELCFERMEYILKQYETSLNAFILEWTSLVATTFNLEVQNLLNLFDDDLDKHNSEMRTRYMFKWRTFSH